MRIPIQSGTSYRGRNSRPNWPVLLLFVGLGLGAGALGAAFSPGLSGGSSRWYAALAKPEWTAPNNWFGPAWTVLYLLMGTGAWLVWRERYHRVRRAALSAYVVQLLINAAWAPLFFGARSVGAGLFVIVALWLAVAWTIREFSAVKPAAAWLLAPYWLWVTYATALNFAIWKLNP